MFSLAGSISINALSKVWLFKILLIIRLFIKESVVIIEQDEFCFVCFQLSPNCENISLHSSHCFRMKCWYKQVHVPHRKKNILVIVFQESTIIVDYITIFYCRGLPSLTATSFTLSCIRQRPLLHLQVRYTYDPQKTAY